MNADDRELLMKLGTVGIQVSAMVTGLFELRNESLLACGRLRMLARIRADYTMGTTAWIVIALFLLVLAIMAAFLLKND
ncbi:MAG TPA: hypothetical protein VJT72_18390 [Pseudonocardiaceae bacterium]|nr:hypothetical protein [Pseudonocardiaceae bacterium]